MWGELVGRKNRPTSHIYANSLIWNRGATAGASTYINRPQSWSRKPALIIEFNGYWYLGYMYFECCGFESTRFQLDTSNNRIYNFYFFVFFEVWRSWTATHNWKLTGTVFFWIRIHHDAGPDIGKRAAFSRPLAVPHPRYYVIGPTYIMVEFYLFFPKVFLFLVLFLMHF